MTFRDGMTLPSLAMARARQRRPSGSLRLALLMLPALLLFLLFFGIPIVRLLVLGFESGFQH